MKQLLLGVFCVLAFFARGQDVCHGAEISTVYGQSKYFEVIDAQHQLDFSVYRNKKNHFIRTGADSLRIEKGKSVYQHGKLLAVYSKGEITLNSGQKINEIATNDGWDYRLEGQSILQVYFSLDRSQDLYYLCFQTNEWNQEAKLAAYLASARFTKSVPMSRISFTAEDVVDIFVDVLYFLSI